MSRVAVTRRAVRALKLEGSGQMAGRGAHEVRAEDVIEAGLEGNDLARRVLRETGEYLGIGISSVVDMFDPELVVVGGSTMKAGELILEPATRVVKKRALSEMAERVRIVPGDLGEDAGAIGAAALVLRELFALSVPRESEQNPESYRSMS